MRGARKESDEKHPDIGRMIFKPVTTARWGDLEKLFESRGGPRYCWCLAWRMASQRRHLSSAQLIEAATAYAKRKGARIVEAYPVGKASPSYRLWASYHRSRPPVSKRPAAPGQQRH